MQCIKRKALAELTRANTEPTRFIADSRLCAPLSVLGAVERLRGGVTRYSGRSILIRVRGQLAAVSAMLALDGVARRLLLCPPDVPEEQIPRLMQLGEVDIMLAEADFEVGSQAVERNSADLSRYDTEWILFTSGTSGFPKLVQHSLASLIAPLADGLPAKNAVWGTFYDIRRYGGLQILLRALIGGGSMVLSEATEPVAAFLSRLDEAGTTHISGTPSHWRRVLMSGAAEKITPAYVRLSGEMTGQDILDRLHAAYPQAAIGHAYASTEAGVAFSVNDGQEGFPATVLCAGAPRPEIKVKSQTLWVRSSAAATRYLGHASRQLADEEGFVDTGDVVELCGDRYMFAGRREGVVNVGGMKVHPEEVEATINRHPAVAMSRVWGRPSPITGTLIAADIVLTRSRSGEYLEFSCIRDEIMATCRAVLEPHKVPVRIVQVTEIPVLNSGKIARHNA